MIKVDDITIKYPNNRGIFNISFEVKKGEVVGYLGPNGAGKTTTIRALMGFMKTNNGTCTINGLDCFKNSHDIMKNLGYIPGEIIFPSDMTCMQFLNYQCELRSLKDKTLMNTLIKRFDLNTKSVIKECSKGMKQKLGIISAFMHDPEFLILDEPTSGLDPLMQNEFIKLVEEEKKKGKTILISSHMFEEIERTCSRVIIIKDGHIKTNTDIESLKLAGINCFIIETEEIDKLKKSNFEVKHIINNTYEISIKGNEVDKFIKELSKITVTKLDVKKQTLENAFLHFYAAEDK